MQNISEKIEELLFKHFSGKLTKEEEKELLIWINSDPSHKKTISQMADWWAIAHTPFFISDLEADFRIYLKKLANQNKQIYKNAPANTKLWYTIAASVLIVFSVGISAFYLGKNIREEAQTIYYETHVPLGSQSKVILPDQSIVWLNASTSLTYHEDLDNKTRNISIKGEGYFEVTPNPERPFIVKSGELYINVLGTSFNLKAYENAATIDLVLITGSVDVNIDQSGSEIEAIRLSPNKMLTYNKENNDIKIATVTGLNYGKWKDRVLKFDEQTFIQIAKDLERIYNTPIIIESDLLKKERFSGSFSYDYSLNDILREVDIDKKYKWEYNENTLIIRDL